MGHVTVDSFQGHGETVGGGALYAARTATMLGARAAVHTSAARDPGVSGALSGLPVTLIPAAHSTRLDIRYHSDGSRKQTLLAMAGSLSFEQLPDCWREVPLVHLAPECSEIDTSFLEAMPESFIGVTAQGWMRRPNEYGEIQYQDWTSSQQVLMRADAIVVSEQDVPDASILSQWAKHARNLVITKAHRGCEVYVDRASTMFHSAAFQPLREQDPTGAGDVFAAAYFWRLFQSRDPVTSAAWANCVASFAVEGVGTSGIPSLDAVRRRWAANERLNP